MTAPVESLELLERFRIWANEVGIERFWGVAKTGDGHVCLLMPTHAADYVALLIEEDDRVSLVCGPAAGRTQNFQHDVGSSTEDPHQLLTEALSWLMSTGKELISASNVEEGGNRAYVAWRIATYMNMSEQALEALSIKNSSGFE